MGLVRGTSRGILGALARSSDQDCSSISDRLLGMTRFTYTRLESYKERLPKNCMTRDAGSACAL